MKAADEAARRAEVAGFAVEAKADTATVLDELRWEAIAIANVAALDGQVEVGAAWATLAGDLSQLWARFAEPNARACELLGMTLATRGSLRSKAGDA